MNADTLALLNEVKGFIRQPYAWPGGYPVYMVMRDGGALCHECAKANFKEIVRATMDNAPLEWCAFDCAVNWEDPQCYCDNCHCKIESAYCED